MNKARIAVFVSGGGTNLQAIIDKAAAGGIPHGELAVVVSSKAGVYALERAAKANIPSVVVSKKDAGSQDAFEAQLLAVLEAYQIDMIILAGFMSILTKNFTDRYPQRNINVHPPLIPCFSAEGFYGLRVHEAALQYGVKVTGATVHFVNEIPDGGQIIAQKAVDILPDDTPETLQKRVMEQAEWLLLPQAAEIVAATLVSHT